MKCAATFAILVFLALAGCSTTSRSDAGTTADTEDVSIRFHVATRTPQEGVAETTDEAGRKMYVAPQPFLTAYDAANISALHSRVGSVLVLRFSLAAAARLERVTRAHVGDLIVVYVDDRLVLANPITRPLTEGVLGVDADLSRARIDEILRWHHERRRTERAYE